jgi:hypothetical protein
MLTRILIGLALVVVGAAITIKTNQLYEWFGSMDWADHYLGPGGSRLMYRLLGILMSIIGFMVATNLWMAFLHATIGEWLHLNPPNEIDYQG